VSNSAIFSTRNFLTTLLCLMLQLIAFHYMRMSSVHISAYGIYSNIASTNCYAICH